MGNAQLSQMSADTPIVHFGNYFRWEVAKRGKKVIVITHHNGIPAGGFDPTADKPLQLYTDVMNAFTGSFRQRHGHYCPGTSQPLLVHCNPAMSVVCDTTVRAVWMRSVPHSIGNGTMTFFNRCPES